MCIHVLPRTVVYVAFLFTYLSRSQSLLLLPLILTLTSYLLYYLIEAREVFIENVTDVDIQYQLFYRTIFKPESGEVSSNR